MSMDLGVVPHPGPDTKNIFNHQPRCMLVKARFYIMALFATTLNSKSLSSVRCFLPGADKKLCGSEVVRI